MTLEAPLNLVIHIGGHKTGSTAIQDTALENSRKLAANGIFYPAQRAYFRHAQHSRLAELLKNGRLKQVSRFLDSASSEARLIGAVTVFLSGEELWTLSSRSVARLREIAEQKFQSIRIISVVRNERDRILSNYKHFLRHDSSRSITQFVHDNRRIMRPAGEIWAKEFPHDLTVLQYDEISDNLVPAFFEKALGCEIGCNPRSNVSFDMLTLAINNTFIKDWKDEGTEAVLWEFAIKYNSSPKIPIESVLTDEIFTIGKYKLRKEILKDRNSIEYDPVEMCDRMIYLFTRLRQIFRGKYDTEKMSQSSEFNHEKAKKSSGL